MLKFLRVIGSGIFFLLLPVVFAAIFVDINYYFYKDAIVTTQELLGGVIAKYHGPVYWWYIIYILVLILAYKTMGKKGFLISSAFWIILVGGLLTYFDKPIEGLVDIPDSVFGEPVVDIFNLPRLSQKQCNELATLTESLSGAQGMFFSSGVDWDKTKNENPELKSSLEYLKSLQEKIDMKHTYNLSTITDRHFLDPRENPGILSGTLTMTDFIESLDDKDKQKASYKNDENRVTQSINESYPAWKNSLSGQDADRLVSVFYTDIQKEQIQKVLEFVNQVNQSGYRFYCAKGTTPTENPIPSMTNDLKITRILSQYAIIQASAGNYVESYRSVQILGKYIKSFDDKQFSLVGAMISVVMKGIYYDSLSILQKLDFPKPLQKSIVENIVNTYDKTGFLKRSYDGEYYMTIHFYMSLDFDIGKLYIPVIFDGNETAKIVKNIYVTFNTLETGTPINTKYSGTDGYYEFLKDSLQVGWDGSIHNIIGKILIAKMTPDSGSYSKRVLLSDIQRNTLLQSFGK